MKIQLKTKRNKGASLPSFKTEGAAGFDLAAYLPNGEIILEPLERALVPTGLYFEIPKGYQGEVRPRSGLAIKSGITVLNSPGTIDSDYRGEVKVILINLSNEPFRIKNGDRIAQMVITKYEECEITEIDILQKTDRGDGGFGSTGV